MLHFVIFTHPSRNFLSFLFPSWERSRFQTLIRYDDDSISVKVQCAERISDINRRELNTNPSSHNSFSFPGTFECHHCHPATVPLTLAFPNPSNLTSVPSKSNMAIFAEALGVRFVACRHVLFGPRGGCQVSDVELELDPDGEDEESFSVALLKMGNTGGKIWSQRRALRKSRGNKTFSGFLFRTITIVLGIIGLAWSFRHVEARGRSNTDVLGDMLVPLLKQRVTRRNNTEARRDALLIPITSTVI
jgi:hypothetical protein